MTDLWGDVHQLAIVWILSSVGLVVYTYGIYPLLLELTAWAKARSAGEGSSVDGEWPLVSISVPAYNEETQIEDLILSLLSLDYPRDRLQILIVSDASSDGTDDIVRRYESAGIELLRMDERGGKTKAENAAASHLRGELIVNTDASIRIRPDALKPLVASFRDPRVGCASGRDISVGPDQETGNVGEGGYVGYEMRIRDLETRAGGIIGASGCFYAIRPHLHGLPLPDELSRDFAAALHTHEQGYRAVSVPAAVCSVPRASGLRKEYRRKVRTMTRGMETLWYKRSLLNPFRHHAFAWKLFSHKICRWAVPWAATFAFVSTCILAPAHPAAFVISAAGVVTILLAAAGWLMQGRQNVPRIFAIPAFLVAGNLAAMHALIRVITGARDALWEPTRREVLKVG